MDLAEVFEQLFFGELSQTSIGATGGGVAVAVADYPKLINHINLGVLALHKKFNLIEKEVFIELHEEITEYSIHWDFATTNAASSEDPKYIADTATNPFNVSRPLKITSVWNEEGYEFDLDPLFVESELLTFDAEWKQLIAYRPKPLLLQIPYPDDDNTISVICQAAPNNISTSATDTSTLIELDDVLLDPLLAFIGDRHFSPVSPNKEQAIAYPNKFKTACQEIIDNGLIPEASTRGYNRFHRNGWR